MSTTTTKVNEYDAIARVVQHYIHGAKSGKGDSSKSEGADKKPTESKKTSDKKAGGKVDSA